MVLGIGTDIVENGRFAKAIERHGQRFLQRVFTPAEIEYCTGSKGLKMESLAARFAGKEAVAKAFGTGIGQLAWTDIEITADAGGAPSVRLFGNAKSLAERMGVSIVRISLSHTVLCSVAFVVLDR